MAIAVVVDVVANLGGWGDVAHASAPSSVFAFLDAFLTSSYVDTAVLLGTVDARTVDLFVGFAITVVIFAIAAFCLREDFSITVAPYTALTDLFTELALSFGSAWERT